MKKLLRIIKKLNPHIVISSFIILSIIGSVIFLAKWNRGVDSTYDRDSIEDGYEIEVLDRVYYITNEQLGTHIPNKTPKVLCFGNAPFADDRNSQDNLCNLIAKETDAEIINLSIPGSCLSMLEPQPNTDGDPWNCYTFYWLMCMGLTKDSVLLNNYNESVRGFSEIGDDVVDYLYQVDINTVDTIVLMYDATDYLEGRPKETSDNISNPHTFCGNMLAGIELIQATYPHIQIIVMSPTYAYAIDDNGEYISSDIFKVDGNSLSAYAINQLNICQLAEVTFIDNIYGTIHADNADMYLTDNVHLNAEGRKLVASRFAEIFKSSWKKYDND